MGIDIGWMHPTEIVGKDYEEVVSKIKFLYYWFVLLVLRVKYCLYLKAKTLNVWR
jgi:hypothetical protein